MEVNRHGNTYKEIECPGCNASIGYCPSDVNKSIDKIEYYFGEYIERSKKYITCPECKTKINLEEGTE